MLRIYRIGGAARKTGLHPQTIRNYEKLGLIIPQRDESGQRVFDDQLIGKIKQIYAEFNLKK